MDLKVRLGLLNSTYPQTPTNTLDNEREVVYTSELYFE